MMVGICSIPLFLVPLFAQTPGDAVRPAVQRAAARAAGAHCEHRCCQAAIFAPLVLSTFTCLLRVRLMFWHGSHVSRTVAMKGAALLFPGHVFVTAVDPTCAPPDHWQGVLNALTALLEFALELDTGRYLQVLSLARVCLGCLPRAVAGALLLGFALQCCCLLPARQFASLPAFAL